MGDKATHAALALGKRAFAFPIAKVRFGTGVLDCFLPWPHAFVAETHPGTVCVSEAPLWDAVVADSTRWVGGALIFIRWCATGDVDVRHAVPGESVVPLKTGIGAGVRIRIRAATPQAPRTGTSLAQVNIYPVVQGDAWADNNILGVAVRRLSHEPETAAEHIVDGVRWQRTGPKSAHAKTLKGEAVFFGGVV